MLASVFHVVGCKVLHGGCQFQVRDIIALETAYVCHRHSPGEKWVFAEDLLDASPTRVAGEIDNRRTVHQPHGSARPFRVRVVERSRLVAHCQRDAVH